MSIFFLVLPYLSFSLNYVSCPELVCSTLDNSKCVEVAESEVLVAACPTNFVCNNTAQFGDYNAHTDAICEAATTTTSTVSCLGIGVANTYDRCCTNSDCGSGVCSNFFCVGIPGGGACLIDEQCAPFYFCSSNICVVSYYEGKACTAHNQCRPGHGCNELKCTQFWSITTGKMTDDAMFCKTGFARNGECDSVLIYVGDDRLDDPYKCNIGDMCDYRYSSDKVLFTSAPCQCAGKDSTKGYCKPQGAVDGIYDVVFPKMKYATSACSGGYAHTTHTPTLFRCWSILTDQYRYLGNMVRMMNNWALYQSGVLDDCAVSMTLYDPDVDIDTLASARTMMVSFLFLIFY